MFRLHWFVCDHLCSYAWSIFIKKNFYIKLIYSPEFIKKLLQKLWLIFYTTLKWTYISFKSGIWLNFMSPLNVTLESWYFLLFQLLYTLISLFICLSLTLITYILQKIVIYNKRSFRTKMSSFNTSTINLRANSSNSWKMSYSLSASLLPSVNLCDENHAFLYSFNVLFFVCDIIICEVC